MELFGGSSPSPTQIRLPSRAFAIPRTIRYGHASFQERGRMAEAKFDVLTIGNAIVDVLAQTEEDFLVREGLVKGSMRLIDGKEADRLFDHMGTTQLVSGGCAGNTAAGVASFGGRAAFIG